MIPSSTQDKFQHISSELANIAIHLHFILEAHQEIINNIKLIKAIGIYSRANELIKVNEALSLVNSKIQAMLQKTGCQTYVNYTKDSNLANTKDKKRNNNFILKSNNMFFNQNNTKFKEMISNMFPSKEIKIFAMPMICNANNILTITRRNQPRKVRLIREPSGINSTIFPRREYHENHMVVICNENLNFILPPPTIHNNAYTINECFNMFHEMRNVNKVKS